MARMVEIPNPLDLVDRVRRDIERNALRVRNGVRLVAGSPAKVGLTPNDVVWESGRARLTRYHLPGVAHRFSPPLVIVYSLISRSYIFDLCPGNSFVETLLTEGFDVYVLDFGIPDERDADNKLEDYVDGYIPAALRRAATLSGSNDVNLVGYCLGGILAILFAARDRRGLIHSFTALAAPVDLSKQGAFSEMFENGRIEVDAIVDDSGNIPASVMSQSFKLLKPTADVSRYANLLDRMWNDEYVHAYALMTQWNSDHVPFPGAVARQGVEMLIRRNGLMTGRVVLGGEAVDLGRIVCPTLVVVADKDHIAPPPSTVPLMDLIGASNKELLALPTGHVGLFVGKSAAKTTIPRLVEYFRRHTSPSTDHQNEQSANHYGMEP
jgi:polyhydroxyalkanoate synthase